MPSQNERRRNNVKTGVFVTVVIVLTVAVIVQLTNALEMFTPKQPYTVRFMVAEGVENLKAGGAVRVGGHELGKVTSVTPETEEEPFKSILVAFDLDRRVRLFDDAAITVSKSLLGGDAWLDIWTVGVSGNEPTGPIPGTPGGGMFASLLGGGKGGDGEGGFDGVIEYVQGFPDREGRKLDEILTNVRDITDDAREKWPTWSEEVSTALTNANDTIEVINGFARHADDALLDNRAQIDTIVDNVEAGTGDAKDVLARFESHTLGEFEKLMASAQTGLDDITGMLEQLEGDFGPWREDFGEVLANATLAAQQLKLTTAEVRRAPWKLLYRPEDTEFRHEMLYDAARSLAIAVADLKIASQSAQRMLDAHADELATDPALMDKIRSTLIEPLGRYERAQQNFLDILVEQGR
ncbi:MAG: MlaD family protein [Planctomycetota bacterium]|jgi:ABC-type transporter Mla subunit MlaD